MSVLFKVLTGATLSTLLVACGGRNIKPKFFDLQPQEKVLIGGFSVNGYITKEGLERLTPGLLESRESFYEGSQNAIDSAAQVFFNKIPSVLSDLEIIPMEDQAANKKYQDASRATSKKIFGIGKSEDEADVYPEAIGFMGNLSSAQKPNVMMEAAGVDAMIKLSFDANLVKAMVGNENIKVEASLGPLGLLAIETEVRADLYRKGKGIVWTGHYTLTGTENAGAVGYLLPDSKIPRLFVSSLEGLPAKLAASLKEFRDKPVVVEAKEEAK